MRNFIVLRKIDSSGVWQSRKGALRQVEEAGTQFGQYVAVPLRQWRVMDIPL
jgi:hypothetical protein